MRRASRLLCALPLVCLVLAAWTSPAHAGISQKDPSPAGGAGSVSVSGPVVSVAVSGSVELLEGSSGPGASSVGVQAAPVCWWEPGRTGAQTAADIQSGYYDVALPQAEELRGVLASLYPGWREHREDTTGRWWAPACDPGRWDGDEQGYRRHAQAFGERGPRRFLPEGQSPPPPTLTPAELATAVRRSLRVPAPQGGHLCRVPGGLGQYLGWNGRDRGGAASRYPHRCGIVRVELPAEGR